MTDRTVLERIAQSLARIADHLDPPAGPVPGALPEGEAFHWDGGTLSLVTVPHVARVPLALLRGIDRVRDILLANTERFAGGHGANNALLWGARGMGKSSLVKAVHADVAASVPTPLLLVEIAREDIATLPALMRIVAGRSERIIVFCDDLSFERDEASYKSLKSILDGGLEGRPGNVIFYATSNRAHLMARDMIDNELRTAINPREAIDEKVSLSDRFGLWLGFHACGQDEFLEMVRAYADRFGVEISDAELRAKALEWAATRGARSGRVALQFARDLAGAHGRPA